MTRQGSFLTVIFIAAALACGACDKKQEGSAAEPGTAAPTPPAPAEPAPSAAAPTGSGIPECDAYMSVVEKYMKCDKIPQAARDATKQGFEASKQSWAALSGTNVAEATKQAAASGCKQGEDALLQGAKALGCTL